VKDFKFVLVVDENLVKQDPEVTWTP